MSPWLRSSSFPQKIDHSVTSSCARGESCVYTGRHSMEWRDRVRRRRRLGCWTDTIMSTAWHEFQPGRKITFLIFSRRKKSSGKKRVNSKVEATGRSLAVYPSFIVHLGMRERYRAREREREREREFHFDRPFVGMPNWQILSADRMSWSEIFTTDSKKREKKKKKTATARDEDYGNKERKKVELELGSSAAVALSRRIAVSSFNDALSSIRLA